MEKKVVNIFETESVFTAFTVLTIVSGIATLILSIVYKNGDFAFTPVVTVLAYVLYSSYKKHQKNLMKGIMGAVLMWILMEEFEFLMEVFTTNRLFYQEMYGSLYTMFLFIKALCVIVVIEVFILHFVINSDRKSSPLEVEMNQVLLFLLGVLYIIDVVLTLLSTLLTPDTIAFLLLKLFIVNMVICIETKLDAFRIIREAKGWKEN